MLPAMGFYGNHRLNNTVVYDKPCTGDSGHMDGWSKVYVLENPQIIYDTGNGILW